MHKLSRGERFKDARTIHNQHGKQTMKEVEERTGVSASLIKDLEDDASTRSVGYEKVSRLAIHYGVSIDWLCGITDAHQVAPCAVDQLGLSEKAVSNLVDLCHSPIMGNAIDGVNMFLENAHFFFAARDAAAFKELVTKELAYREQNKEKLSEGNPFYLDGAEYDLEMMEIEACDAVKKLFPEFADRIEVAIGKHYIEHERQRIIGAFESCLIQCTNYQELLFAGIGDD